MKIIRKNIFLKWIEILVKNQLVYAPIFDGKRWKYNRLHSKEELTEKYILPNLSIKSFIFPPVEKIFSFSKQKEEIMIYDIQLKNIKKKILFGIRPCDAVGINHLSSFFKKDKADEIVQAKMEKITIISYACNKADEYCFCTSVGGNPGNTQGSDILLTKRNAGDFFAEILTEKGEELLSIIPKYLEENINEDKKEDYLAHVPIHFNISTLTNKMNSIFDCSVFDQFALKCLGCHVCSYTCPTCSCFDIQDHNKGNNQGDRIRCWDSCSSPLFTLHTSGYNPRSTQGMRWKQRLMHKFSFTKKIKCVGCGRCSRNCPIGMNLIEELTNILNS